MTTKEVRLLGKYRRATLDYRGAVEALTELATLSKEELQQLHKKTKSHVERGVLEYLIEATPAGRINFAFKTVGLQSKVQSPRQQAYSMKAENYHSEKAQFATTHVGIPDNTESDPDTEDDEDS